jgi:hypothetical protein
MPRQTRRLIALPVPASLPVLALVLVCGAGWGRNAGAQTSPRAPGGRFGTYSNGNVAGGGAGSGASNNTGFYSNPYAVPTMNPFLNPYAAMYAPASPQNAALYFFAAQQSMGGIGSGQMSGTRPGPAAAAPPPIPSDRRVSDTPGAGAARYFNRSVKGGGVPDRHYNRFGNYYSANGH